MHNDGIVQRDMISFAYMNVLHSEVRARPEYQLLNGETWSTRTTGASFSRSSTCESDWTLNGSNGVLEVKTSFANGFDWGLVTKVTVQSPDFGEDPVMRTFGGDHPLPSTVGNVIPVIAEWLQVITKHPSSNGLIDLVVPKVP